MPQKNKDIRKEYNRQQYLKKKSKKEIERREINIEENNYHLLKFFKNIQKVNELFINVKLKHVEPIDDIVKEVYPLLNREKALKDFEILKTLDASQYLNARRGEMFVNYFTFSQRLKTKGSKNMSFLDFVNQKSKYEDKPYVKKMLDFYSEHKKTSNLTQMWYRIFNLYFGSITIFKPTIAMSVYSRYKPQSVLDMTMGWGGRLVGACALNIPKYTGIDLNTDLKKPYEDMVSMLNQSSNTEITLYFENALKIDYSKIDYDMVLTSPPYYNIEQYNHQPVLTKPQWEDDFYKPLFERTWRHLKPNGYYCINVPNKIYETILKDLLGEADEFIPLNKTKRTQDERYKEYIYVWKK